MVLLMVILQSEKKKEHFVYVQWEWGERTKTQNQITRTRLLASLWIWLYYKPNYISNSKGNILHLSLQNGKTTRHYVCFQGPILEWHSMTKYLLSKYKIQKVSKWSEPRKYLDTWNSSSRIYLAKIRSKWIWPNEDWQFGEQYMRL